MLIFVRVADPQYQTKLESIALGIQRKIFSFFISLFRKRIFLTSYGFYQQVALAYGTIRQPTGTIVKRAAPSAPAANPAKR